MLSKTQLHTEKHFTGTFSDPASRKVEHSGGKGAALARMFQAGFAVPDGFVIFPAAFQGDNLDPAAWTEIIACLQALAKGGALRFAVRSSALGEDAANASYAGGFESFLNRRSDTDFNEIREAILAVCRSRHGDRVAAYDRAVTGKDQGGPAHAMAVVVQIMVAADFAGVLFTADAVTGDRNTLTGNFVKGLGDRLVSGEANPMTFSIGRVKQGYQGAPELAQFAGKLRKLGMGLEREFGSPQDIEWAIAGGKLFALQSRPITTMRADNPRTGEWNDSLTGDYIWTSANFGEAVPDVMTPLTWSIMARWFEITQPEAYPGGHPQAGNIAGRYYFNFGLPASLAAALGSDPGKAVQGAQASYGLVPADIQVPLVHISKWDAMTYSWRQFFNGMRRGRRDSRLLAPYLENFAILSRTLREDTAACKNPEHLVRIWREKIEPFFRQSVTLVQLTAQNLGAWTGKAHRVLRTYVEPKDAICMLTAIGEDGAHLESLGPLVGLAKVAEGRMGAKEFMDRYGHRSAHEFELSIPRPVEQPGWLDHEIATMGSSADEAEKRLAEQRKRHEEAWTRFREKYPHKLKQVDPIVANFRQASLTRENVRSGMALALWNLRCFATRAGEVLGIEDGVFFLSMEELLDVLEGNETATQYIPARRKTYVRYCELPPLPPVIRGRFDPFKWAADPNRRQDAFDAQGQGSPPKAMGNQIRGMPGAAGIIEGSVRVLLTLDQGNTLKAGEILVTVTTNVGWTPLFPRAAAVVTDVGAPLSHAAIVARELGVPAVVGCGNATVQLKTGDRVRVDGGRGIVEKLRFL